MRGKDSSQDEGESLVTAMTRPTMVGGFTLTSLAISIYFPVMAALITKSLWAGALIPIFLLVSYLICLKDVYLLNILSAATYLKTSQNKRLWKCRRYAPR